MVATVIDPEQWQATYEAASLTRQYEMLLEVMAQPLSLDLIEELDLEMLVLTMRDELVNRHLFDQAIALIQTVQQQQPSLHQQEFAVLDSFLVEYYLYCNHPQQVRAALQQFLQYPAADIDQTLAILDYLKFYNATSLAVELSQVAYEAVQASANRVLGVEMQFSDVLLGNWMQQAHQQLKQGHSVDWNTFLAESVKYEFDKYEFGNKAQWIKELEQHLTREVQNSPEFVAQFRHDRSEALRTTSLGFCQYMAEEKQVSFICSRALWESIYTFLEHRETSGTKLAQPESYFAFSLLELEIYVAQKIGALLSTQQSVGVAVLWGIPYVYDFLRSKQIISRDLHQQAIKSVAALKTALINNYAHLWKYSFVHRWLPPDSVATAEFEAEKQCFAASFERVVALDATLDPLLNPLVAVYPSVYP
ncbi:hypothetical protein [Thermocoleostomius sinensis]|uniref:Uncharacterized protein n=1 Tax=Thermocoleostomius sinensis A174 TaxID=2016057 RepID=A0A9E8ZBE4_9CYAN|nr:hypothetical protein [Thermocoleostomius sinensis]WAL60043.1 hypothetical protein OXH18_23195 [Thermocoleostomius sinensis A174]